MAEKTAEESELLNKRVRHGVMTSAKSLRRIFKMCVCGTRAFVVLVLDRVCARHDPPKCKNEM